ncbi:MAG TPA: hypothetical protein PLL18_06790 [Flavobacteriales bacterium]|nr:hypothetical protein [Flavobacteriales bacterium]
MRIAVVGATGMVGGVMLHVLEERMGAEVEELTRHWPTHRRTPGWKS